MNKILKKTLKTTSIILLSLLILIFVLAIVNLFVTTSEKKYLPAPGVLVDINGKKMHVYTQGNGDIKIILLPGLGITSPVYDFGPLIEELKGNYSVTVVEPFGYGWSEGTKEKRDIRLIVEEIRKGLKQADIFPPYVLMPHSISGLYAQYFASSYPEEIQGIIGLDTSVPNQALSGSVPSGINVYGLLRNLGIGRVILAVAPGLLGYPHEQYTSEERKIINMFALWNMDNQAIWNESLAIHGNSVLLLEVKIPKDIPVLFLLSNQTVTHFASIGMDWEKEHQGLALDQSNVGVSVLEGGYCIHWTASRQIATLVNQWIRMIDIE